MTGRVLRVRLHRSWAAWDRAQLRAVSRALITTATMVEQLSAADQCFVAGGLRARDPIRAPALGSVAMPRDAVRAAGAPVAVGPYSHAVRAGGLVYLSGQTPIDPATGRLVEGDVAAQTARVFANLASVLAEAGLGLDEVIKVNVYLTDMADFAAMNQVYAGVFSEPFPARTTVAVAALPLGARVEIEAIACA